MEYIGKIKNDKKLLQNKNGIVIFGAGNDLGKLLYKLNELHVKERVICICDNNPERQGKENLGIKIVNPEYAFSHYADSSYIAYNKFRLEICKQLVTSGIERIHLISD